MSTLMSTSLVTWKAPPAACLKNKEHETFGCEQHDSSKVISPGEVACWRGSGAWRHGVTSTAHWAVRVGYLGEDPAAGEPSIHVGVTITGHLALDTVASLPGVLGKVPRKKYLFFRWNKRNT